MKPATPEWVRKAEGDLGTAKELTTSLEDRADPICFHSQQAAEKYIKAVLVERSIAFPMSHDLTELAALIEPPLEKLTKMRADLDELSRMAVQIRYPGFDADVRKARRAVEIAERVRLICRAAIGLE
ncbi:MAG: HEPN domain-containing protein [Phycisphaerales bacterium]